MHLRLKKGSYEYIDNSDLVVHQPKDWKGRWNEVFGNDRPVHLEVGSGRGSFITQLAMLNPGINYVAVELYASPMYRAIKRAEETSCTNLRFLRMDAEFLPEVFDRDEVSRIYLNFSDPWPKTSKGNKRLTSSHYLQKYDLFLSEDGRIEFKTDNEPLFRFSLQEAESQCWVCSEVTDDLHSGGNPEWNVMTDYEMAFVEKGVPIHRVVLTRDRSD
ncbi:MAG: tRNA (guanosine(46)-N7)-methyltransferase TrmB [archaeon]|nr:tRNA (guanosine(46)-N7)-methyltransferase TrmB [archaeon]